MLLVCLGVWWVVSGERWWAVTWLKVWARVGEDMNTRHPVPYGTQCFALSHRGSSFFAFSSTRLSLWTSGEIHKSLFNNSLNNNNKPEEPQHQEPHTSKEILLLYTEKGEDGVRQWQDVYYLFMYGISLQGRGICCCQAMQRTFFVLSTTTLLILTISLLLDTQHYSHSSGIIILILILDSKVSFNLFRPSKKSLFGLNLSMYVWCLLCGHAAQTLLRDVWRLGPRTTTRDFNFHTNDLRPSKGMISMQRLFV